MSEKTSEQAGALVHYSKLGLNDRVKIIGFAGESLLTDRLQELGLHHGLTIQFVGRAPFHGPLLFSVGATVIALRDGEAACLLLSPL